MLRFTCAFALFAGVMVASIPGQFGHAGQGLRTMVQASTSDVLKDLPGVYVSIQPLRKNVEAAGLTTQDLQKAVETRLTQSGVKLLTREALVTTPGAPVLYVNANIVGSGSVFVYSIRVDLEEQAILMRSPHTSVAAVSTWQKGVVGLVQQTRLSEAKAEAVQLVGFFCEDWTVANPPSGGE